MLKKPKLKDYLKGSSLKLKGFKFKFLLLIFCVLMFVWVATTGVNNRCQGNLTHLGESLYQDSSIQQYNDTIKKDVATITKLLDNDYDKVKLGTLSENGAKINGKNIVQNFISDDEIFNYWIEEEALPEKELGITEKKVKDGKKESTIVVYSKIYEPYNWTLCASYDKSSLDKDFTTYHNTTRSNKIKMMQITSLFGLILILIVCAICSIFAFKISSWIHEVRNIALALKQGDLTNKMIYDHKDELRETSNALNESQINLINLIKNIEGVATNLKNSVEDFTENHLKMNASIDSVSSSIFDITKNINEQTLSTSAVTSSVNDISSSIEQTANEIKLLNENSKSMQEYSEKSKDSLTDLININTRTLEDIQKMYSQTESTNDSVNKISVAADLINQIATQTNLLSLNASIEAARAGEHGKGFSVVATEIGNLATQSSATVKEINTLLNELTDNSAKSINIVKEMTDASSVQNNTLQSTAAMFDSLSQALNNCIDSIGRISSQIQLVTTENNAIQTNIENLNNMSANNAAYTEETSAMAEELTDMVSSSTNKIQELSVEFDNLSDSINNFKF